MQVPPCTSVSNARVDLKCGPSSSFATPDSGFCFHSGGPLLCSACIPLCRLYRRLGLLSMRGTAGAGVVPVIPVCRPIMLCDPTCMEDCSHCKHMKSFGHLWHPLVVQHCEACACQFNTKCIVEPFECMFHLRLWSLLLQNCRISDCNLNCPCILVDICRFCVCPPAYPLFFDPNVCFSLSHCLLFAVQFVHAEWSPSLLQSWCL